MDNSGYWEYAYILIFFILVFCIFNCSKTTFSINKNFKHIPCLAKLCHTTPVKKLLIFHYNIQAGSVQFTHSIMSDSLQPHRLQHTRVLCLSPSLRACSHSCLLRRWCHPTISSSVMPFSFCPQSFPASESFPVTQLFASGGQSIGDSASASVLLMDTQDWSLQNGLVGSPCSPRDSQESSPIPQFKSINSSVLSFLYGPTHIHPWLLEKPSLWLYRPLSVK